MVFSDCCFCFMFILVCHLSTEILFLMSKLQFTFYSIILEDNTEWKKIPVHLLCDTPWFA